MGSYDLSFFRGYLWKNISWDSIWDKDNVQPEECSSQFVYNFVMLRPKFKVTYFRFLNYFPFTFRSWSSTKVFEIKGLETWLFSLEIAVLTFHYIRGLSLHNVKGMKKSWTLLQGIFGGHWAVMSRPSQKNFVSATCIHCKKITEALFKCLWFSNSGKIPGISMIPFSAL